MKQLKSLDTAVKKDAESYIKDHEKNSYTTDDIIKCYHRREEERCVAGSVKGLRYVYGINGKTTAMSNGIAGNSGNRQDWD